MNTHTEKEAAEKLCPERANRGYPDSMSSVGSSYPDRCVGSDCMWWQWLAREASGEQRGFCGAIWRYR